LPHKDRLFLPLHRSLLEKWELKIISRRKLKQQDMTAENLSLGRTQRMNRNTAGTYFNMLEKAATDSNLSDIPGNIFSIDEIGVHINNKPESVITRKGLKSPCFNTGIKE
jgi:hypothetical protein